ncbi:Cytochrome c, mono-and diheme variants [Flagellimonas taeanensis]|jgi:mono/diheme cytochrome c family protein|uniref:Cytochrome c, mono-and diheme variants n=1 Tax=Flagellimonas taeanensis TaxID=1005926 RepID=A0A1M6TGX4_9FLAO|nr:cytochrome c [Allomuricauda taeanensis]SFB88111.1 Cytochrome c, mono-and diheme variants [Allomuricauda taeanensis]SHK56018.1 quinol:cytochrome c oxidoreductase monoheme cytochrome subunit [Allomuricauda taeanensis]
MKHLGKISVALVLVLFVAACADKNSPNYQYMPNMYEPVGYETYQGVDNGLFPEGTEAMLPVEGTISRGYMPYEFENTPEGKELARLNTSPLDSLKTEDNLATGMQLYTIYCAICHGDKGDGQGNLVKREKILGVPSYADPARNITVGTTYHTIYYGLNSMGSYASQFANEEEMWQVSEYVMKLKEDLTK